MRIGGGKTAATFEVISNLTFAGGDGLDRDAAHCAIDAFIERNVRMSILNLLPLPAWFPRPRLPGGQRMGRQTCWIYWLTEQILKRAVR